jgi:O-antigen/teichoic acid export membrane protein
MRRRVIGLFAANALSFLVVGLSFIAYSRILSPSELGLYAMALSSGTLLTLVLDGGLKTSVIKMEEPLRKEQEASIILLMLAVSVFLIALLQLFVHLLLAQRPEIRHDAKFVVLFVGI